MALSKPVKVDMSMSKEITQKLDVHEIENYSQYFVAETVSIDVINGYLGSPDTSYFCCEEDQSMEVYFTCCENLLEVLNNSACPLMFFEEFQSKITNIMVAVLHQKKEKGQREHLNLFCVVQMTMMTIPRVSYAHNCCFTSKGSLCLHFYHA